MVIEFLGIPGCGKTFFANESVKELRFKKVSAVNLIEKSRTSFLYKFLFRYWSFVFCLSPVYKRLTLNLTKILQTYRSIPAKYNSVCIDRYVGKIAFYLLLYKKLEKRKKIFFFDEGVFQQFVNIMVNYGVLQKDIMKVIYVADCMNIKKIFLDISVQESLFSIKKRNRHVCFIDDLNENTLKIFLKEYKSACLFLQKKCNIETVSRSWNFEKKIDCLKRVVVND